MEVRMNAELRAFVWKFYGFKFMMSIAFFAPIMTKFFTDYGRLTLFEMQLVQAWFQVWIVIAEIPSGAFADAFGRRTAMLVGTMMSILGLIVYSSIPELWVFLLGELLLAFGKSFLSGADSAMLRGILTQHGSMSRYGECIRVGRIASHLGISFGSLTGGLVFFYLGYPATFGMTALPVVMAALLLFTVKDLKVTQKDPYVQVIKEGLYVFTRSRKLQRLTLNMLVVSCASYFVIWYYQLVIGRVGVPVHLFGIFHVILSGSQIAVLYCHNEIVRRYGGHKTLTQISALMTGLGMIIALHESIVAAVVFITLAGGFGLSRSDTLAEDIARYTPADRHATVVSVVSMLRHGITALVLLALGPVVDASLNVALIVLATLAFSALLVGLPSNGDSDNN